MRVALVSANAQAGDAIGNQVAEKLAFFRERGAQTRVFVESEAELHPAVRPHCQALAAEARGEGWRYLASADLVVVEFGQHYDLLHLLPLLAGGKGRVLIDYHGVTPPQLWGGHNREALERGVRHRGIVWCADGVLVHSGFTGREVQQGCRFPAARLHTLGFPIDLSQFCPGRPQTDIRRELDLDDAFILLYVGRLAPNKGLPVLVEALERLGDASPAVHAVIVGNLTDLYREEMTRCRRLAQERGLGDRLHFIGSRTGAALRDVYRSADVFVTASRWESFCIPVVEAMACGLPVVAARTTALPETVGDAGLTFRADDANDLARQVERIADCRLPIADCNSLRADGNEAERARRAQSAIRKPPSAMRIAIVSFRYGLDFAGGAERSLRTIAQALAGAGHGVEIFSTCTRHESNWSNELPEGTQVLDGLPLHRFRIDAHDRGRHLQSVRLLLESGGIVAPNEEQEYLRHSIHSQDLVEALRKRIDEFDAIVVGPYLFGLTHDVAQAFPDKTLLLPCFHAEPVARLSIWPQTYASVAAILYHSDEERRLAEQTLGVNHPGAVVIGTLLRPAEGDPEIGRRLVGSSHPYVVYCGRYSEQKGLPELLEHARRYQADYAYRFDFVFVGQGDVAIPAEPCFRDLGFVSEADKRHVMAGAAALVQLSRFESLSLVALEAWGQGTPVIAHRDCAVLARHVERSGGGRVIADADDFASALDDLWENPDRWRDLGRRGQAYVQSEYGSERAFLDRLEQALGNMRVPLAEQMRRRGLERARLFERSVWRERFGRVVEQLLDEGPRAHQFDVRVQPCAPLLRAVAGSRRLLLPARLINNGTHAALPEGPGRTVLRCRLACPDGSHLKAETALAGLLTPGESQSVALAVPVPAEAGEYAVSVWAERCGDAAASETGEVHGPTARLTLAVQTQLPGKDMQPRPACAMLLDAAGASLADAHESHRLPDDYADITHGWLARGKRWLKRKLLGNFKAAYVDVLSRQQSRVNRQLVTAVRHLAEGCATLDHAVQALHQRLARIEERLDELAQVTAGTSASGNRAPGSLAAPARCAAGAPSAAEACRPAESRPAEWRPAE